MEAFFRAFFAPEATVLGYRLRPFCAGHKLLLRALGNPMAGDGADGAEPVPADLVLACRVCGLGYPFRDDLRLTPRDCWRARKLERNPARFHAAASAFVAYVVAHSSGPEFWEMEKAPAGWRGTTAPPELVSVAGLVRLGFPYREAWEMSLGEARWVHCACLELEGNPRRFVDPDELAAAEPPPAAPETEAEVLAQVSRDLGPVRARAFMAAWRENQKRRPPAAAGKGGG